jgi:hypothetical protein
MKNMFFVREVKKNSDKIFLKPMTLKEYVLYVNNKMKERVSLAMNYVEHWRDIVDEEQIIKYVNRMMTFEYYPVPCENYKGKNVWINAMNLEKYRI